MSVSEEAVFSYHGRPLKIVPGPAGQPPLFVPMGLVTFTRAGRELFSICEPEPIEGLFDETGSAWQALLFPHFIGEETVKYITDDITLAPGWQILPSFVNGAATGK